MSAIPIVSGEQGAGSRLLPDEPAPLRTKRPAPCLLRSAALADVPALETLIAPFVAAGDLLPRGRYDFCRHIKEYHVATTPDGVLVGSAALKIYSLELGELAALAVRDGWQGGGVGRALVTAVVAEARRHGLAELFALTRKPLFFLRLGFSVAERAHFPLKVWADCARCPRQDACDETAVVLRL